MKAGWLKFAAVFDVLYLIDAFDVTRSVHKCAYVTYGESHMLHMAKQPAEQPKKARKRSGQAKRVNEAGT